MKTSPLLSCAAALLALAAPAAHALDLTVEVLNTRSDKGTVAGAVYGEAVWLREPLHSSRQPTAAKTVLVYRNLAAGRYGLAVYQDENGNGKLDYNLIGMPTEPYGFSRNAGGHMGAPSFADAALDLQVDT